MAMMWMAVLLIWSSGVIGDDNSRGPRVEDLVRPQGYPLETHVVTTADGYNLALYHIPHGRTNAAETHKPVVYMQHGLLDTCATFLMTGPEGSLGFILADRGFDVWLGNTRGNTFSSFAIQKNIDVDEFWDFSLDELAEYDLPATLQYVLDETGVEQLSYVAHSQGTGSAHALFSTQHPITERINLAIMLSPVAYVKHITSHFVRGLAVTDTDALLKSMGFHQFLPSVENLHRIAGPFCSSTVPACSDAYSTLYGYNPGNIDQSRWDTYLTYTPAGASMKLMTHWAQAVRSLEEKRFQKYDYGTKCWNWWQFRSVKCNQRMYKSRSPPRYDLGKIRVPLIYFQGGHDALADLEDVENLKSSLAPGVLVEDNIILDYTHLDFIWGMDARFRVFEKTVERLMEVHQGYESFNITMVV